MNLLVGLTVNRIEELMKTGEKIQASKKVEDIVGMAKIVFESQISKNLNFCIRRDWMPWMQKGIMQRLGDSRQVSFLAHFYSQYFFHIKFYYFRFV